MGRRLVFLGLLCACAALAAATENVVFRTTDFAPAPDSAFSIEGKAQLAVYRAFCRKYPGVIPEGNPLGLQFEGAAGEAPLLMSIAGGTAPDVIHVNGRQSGSYASMIVWIPQDETTAPQTCPVTGCGSSSHRHPGTGSGSWTSI